jgi:hypothetical protein
MEDERRNTRKEQRLVEVRMIQEVTNCQGIFGLYEIVGRNWF